MSEENNQIDETKASLDRLLDFELSKLSRREELGSARDFDSAIKPASKVIEIFKKIPVQNLSELPQNELKLIEKQADAFYAILEKIEEFDPDVLTSATRDQIVDQIKSQFQPIFTKLHPLISYLTIRTTDFAELETNARAAVEGAKKAAAAATKDVADLAASAETAMETIRATAAEQGVSQQAIYFKTEADIHEKSAKLWRKITGWAAGLFFILAISSFFFHEIPILKPENAYETVQMALSKFLLFAVSGYLLVLSARNFLSHKHNMIVNRHKQNSLVTFKAIAEAANQDESQNIILEQAAVSIFAIPESGFTKSLGATPTVGNSVVKLAPPSMSS